MKITVIGGGHVGTLMAAEFAHKGHSVTVFTSKPQQWNNEITVYQQNMEVLFQSQICCITDDMKTAIVDAEYIWVVLPAFMFEDTAKKMLPYVSVGQKIGIVPGSGGAEFAFSELVKKGCTLFGLQRVHSIARLEQYGHSVHMLGRKSQLEIGAIPSKEVSKIAKEVEAMFDIPVKALPNYLCVTLTPSNPILHTTRLYSMFREYKPGIVYPKNFLFYEEWDDASSEMLFACDEELQTICKSLESMDLTSVQSLPVYYESPTVKKMTQKISHIPAFKGLTSPMKEIGEGWVPDFASRYFEADFPYGLKIILDIGRLLEVSVPNIEKVWEWYRQVAGKEKATFTLTCNNMEEFYSIYK